MCWTVSEIVIIVTNTCLASGGTEAKTVCDGPYPLQLLIIVALKQVVLIVSDNVPTATLYFLEGVDTSGCDESVGGQVFYLELTVIFDFTVFPLGLTWNENPTGNIEPEAAAVRVCRQRAALGLTECRHESLTSGISQAVCNLIQCLFTYFNEWASLMT